MVFYDAVRERHFRPQGITIEVCVNARGEGGDEVNCNWAGH